jgi:hypothetical protein
MDPANLQKWLSERSHYIVPENYKYQERMKVIVSNFVYPNADIPVYYEPPVAQKPPPPKSGEKVYVGMSNIGSSIYREGKRTKSLLSINVPGIGDVKMISPRVGIFKVGQGLFLPLLADVDSWDSAGNSLKRLMMYFHEARHSDGNGKSLGFGHAPCPPGSTYAGFYGCDRNQNGPYTIGGTFLRAAVSSCEKCSSAEKEALRNLYADQFSRILTAGLILNAASSGAPVDSKADSCAALKNLNIAVDSVAACSKASSSETAAALNQTAILNPNAPEHRPAWLNDAPEIGVVP